MSEWIKKNAFNLFITAVITVFSAGIIWSTLSGDITDNTTRSVLNAKNHKNHLDDIKNAPITTLGIQTAVRYNTNDIAENTEDIESTSDIQITIREKQNNIVDDIEEIKEYQKEQRDVSIETSKNIGKIMGKLGIE